METNIGLDFLQSILNKKKEEAMTVLRDFQEVFAPKIPNL